MFIKRLSLLLRNDLFINKIAILTFMAALAGVLFLYSIISPVGAAAGNFHPVTYLLLLFIGGFWLTSRSFSDLQEPPRSYTFLTLPASNFEKFFSKLLLTSVGYILGTIIFYFLLSLLVVGFSKLLFPNVQYVFNPFQNHIPLYCGEYIILQSVFFLGAIYFRKHALTKTILALSCFAIIFGLFSLILVKSNALTRIVETIFWIGLAPFCWIVAYIRLQEFEA